MRSGDVVIPAVFHGTARLMRPGEMPAPPRPLRHDDVEGAFRGEFDLSFEVLLGLGYVPVDPSHPAYPSYLAVSNAPPAPPPAPVHDLDPNHPDTVILPFDTVVNIPAERALQFGLVPPGWATGEAEPAVAPQPVRRRNVPPPVWTGPGSSADRRTPPPPPIGDYETFLRFLGDPDQHPLPGGNGDAGPGAIEVASTPAPHAPAAHGADVAAHLLPPVPEGVLPSSLMASADGIVAPGTEADAATGTTIVVPAGSLSGPDFGAAGRTQSDTTIIVS